jgi:hypothetical protein
MRFRYEIDEKNAIRMWDDENPTDTGAPCLYQPDRPDVAPWADRAEAQAWVDAFIAGLLAPAPEPSGDE